MNEASGPAPPAAIIGAMVGGVAAIPACCAAFFAQEKARRVDLRIGRCSAASRRRLRRLPARQPDPHPTHLSAVRHPDGGTDHRVVGEHAQPRADRTGDRRDPAVGAARTGRQRLSGSILPYRDFSRAIAGRAKARRPASGLRHDRFCRGHPVGVGADAAAAAADPAARNRRAGCVLRWNQRCCDWLPLFDRRRRPGFHRPRILAGRCLHPGVHGRTQRVGQGARPGCSAP